MYHGNQDTLVLHAGLCLTDEAAVLTWKHGGRVFLADRVLGGGPVAAVLRF